MNGMEGYTVVTRRGSPLDGGEGPVRWAVLYRDKTAFLFGGASRSGTAGLPADDGLFLSSIQTMRNLKPSEYPLAQPYRIKIIKATEQDEARRLRQGTCRSRSTRRKSCSCSTGSIRTARSSPGSTSRSSSKSRPQRAAAG